MIRAKLGELDGKFVPKPIVVMTEKVGRHTSHFRILVYVTMCLVTYFLLVSGITTP